MELTQQFYSNLSNITVILAVIAVFFYLYLHKKGRILDFIIALTLAVSVSEGFKFYFNTPRPVSTLNLEGGAFPSTHATVAYTAFFFYLLVCHTFTQGKGTSFKELRKPKEAAFFIAIFLLSFASAMLRILAVAHYLTDIIAGIILGLLISFVFVYYDLTARRSE